MAWTYEKTKQGYGNLWRSMTIEPGDDAQATTAVKKILSLESEYRHAFEGAGLKWFLGAIIHYREASNNLKGAMVNGELIVGTGEKTRLVPEGRGPYATFRDSVQDAATIKGWRDIDWRPIERFLFQSELWNGTGYVSKGVNAPFVWAGTNHEEPGLFVADHVFDPNVEDKRMGTAGLLKRLFEMRPDLAREMYLETDVAVLPPPTPQPQPTPAPVPVPTPASTGDQNAEAWRQSFAQLLPIVTQLLQARLQPQGPPVVNVTPTTPPKSDSISQRPSVGFGSILTALIGGMQATGNATPPNTLQGFLMLAIPAAATVLAATNPGGLGGLAATLLSAFGRLRGSGTPK